MINKRSGQVAYAVLSFGGFLGMGDEHYPIPWQQLTYDTDLEGYRTDLTKEKLEGRQNTQAAVTGTGKTGSKAAKYTITMDRRG